MVKCIFTAEATAQQRQQKGMAAFFFSSLAPAKGYAQKNCARFDGTAVILVRKNERDLERMSKLPRGAGVGG